MALSPGWLKTSQEEEEDEEFMDPTPLQDDTPLLHLTWHWMKMMQRPAVYAFVIECPTDLTCGSLFILSD